MCNISTVDASPKLERQVNKMLMQMKQQVPSITVGGYFKMSKNIILYSLALATAFCVIMIQFNITRDPNAYVRWFCEDYKDPWGNECSGIYMIPPSAEAGTIAKTYVPAQ